MQDSGRDSKPGVGARNVTRERIDFGADSWAKPTAGISRALPPPPVGEPIVLSVVEDQCKRCGNMVPALWLWDGRCIDCGW